MQKRRETDKFIKPIVLVGVCVFVVCLATCIFHIYDLKHNLEEVINRQLEVQLEVSGKVLSDEINTTQRLVDTAAAEMREKQKRVLSPFQIYQFLGKYGSLDEFVGFAYIAPNNMIYFDSGQSADATGQISGEIEAIEKNGVYFTDEFENIHGEELLMFITKVDGGKEQDGYIVALKSCRNILAGDSFSYLKKVGDVIVTDQNGRILDCYFANVTGQTEHYVTLYDYMDRYWHLEQDRIKELGGLIYSKEVTSGGIECSGKEGDRYFYSYVNVEAMPELTLVSMYTDSIYDQVEGTIIIGSVISAIVMMVSMAVLVFFVYRHNFFASQLIKKLAYEDEITGGRNLNYFKEFVSEMLYKYQGMSFMIHRFDIANFRYINEAYGHVRADQLLKIIVEESANIFCNKELCVRMNADQFVMLTKNTRDLEERFFVFTDKVNARALDIGIRFPIKFKRGVYQIKNREDDISLLIDRANVARKTMNGEEKECVVYYSDKLVNDMRKVDKIESEMERALFNGEFLTFIQPKWDIREDHLYGGEALVRWVREDGSMTYPSEFVPVFEKNGFVEQLDIYMLESVCRLIREQLDEKKPIYPISVNQSRVLLHNPDYIDKITELLNHYQIPKGYIELEITETVFFTEREKMLSILGELKEREVMLSMDDFGSGYSSLNMLKDFPFDVLKIDREFFSESITSESSTWILRKIVEMAEGLGIRVICEGVETKEQVEMLKKIGCRYVQGYYYSKPIPAERFVQLYCQESA